MQHQPSDPHFEARVRDNFARQGMMEALGARLVAVRPGEVEIVMPYPEGFSQQHGYVHAAAVTAIADSACGYAALSLMEAGRDVLSVEFKVNLTAPAAGERFIATGRVLRPGKTLTVCAGEVHAEQGGDRTLVAVIQATMIAVDHQAGSTVRQN